MEMTSPTPARILSPGMPWDVICQRLEAVRTMNGAKGDSKVIQQLRVT
jgi:hypothetical protein